jgi:hypothetical protein
MKTRVQEIRGVRVINLREEQLSQLKPEDDRRIQIHPSMVDYHPLLG